MLRAIAADKGMSGAYRVAALRALKERQETACLRPCCKDREHPASVLRWLDSLRQPARLLADGRCPDCRGLSTQPAACAAKHHAAQTFSTNNGEAERAKPTDQKPRGAAAPAAVAVIDSAGQEQK